MNKFTDEEFETEMKAVQVPTGFEWKSWEVESGMCGGFWYRGANDVMVFVSIQKCLDNNEGSHFAVSCGRLMLVADYLEDMQLAVDCVFAWVLGLRDEEMKHAVGRLHRKASKTRTLNAIRAHAEVEFLDADATFSNQIILSVESEGKVRALYLKPRRS